MVYHRDEQEAKKKLMMPKMTLRATKMQEAKKRWRTVMRMMKT
jgi:hypothetical protein